MNETDKKEKMLNRLSKINSYQKIGLLLSLIGWPITLFAQVLAMSYGKVLYISGFKAAPVFQLIGFIGLALLIFGNKRKTKMQESESSDSQM